MTSQGTKFKIAESHSGAAEAHGSACAPQEIQESARETDSRRGPEDSCPAQARFARAALDALTSHIAVLDEAGNIVATNKAWRDFAAANSPAPEALSAGANYLGVCDRARGEGAEEAARFAAGIRAVMRNDLAQFSIEYPCHSSAAPRWFVGRVTRLDSPGPTYVVVSHENITERKQAEERLQSTQQWFEAILGASRDGILVEDGERILYVNEAYSLLLGYDGPGELAGRHVSAVIAPGDAAGMLSLGRRRLRGEEAMPAYEFKGRRRDGTLVDLEASVSTAAVEGKTYIITSVRDIRERKQAEERLAEQASLAALDAEVGAALTQSDDLRDMLRHCAEAMVRNLDAAFARIWTLNDAEQVLELQASAGMYTHLDGPHSRVPVGQLKIGLIARERAPHLTNDVQSDPRVSDKEWAEREGVTAFAGYPLVVEGRLVGVMAMFARRPLTEVTLRAMASAANGIAMGIGRKRASEELRREKEFSESLINSSIDGIIAFDHQYRYTVWNPGMEGITGIKREEALGRCAFDLFPFLKEIGEDKYFSAALEGRSVVAKDRRYTVPQTGQEGFFEGHYSPLHDESGEIVGGLATIMDVTRRKQMELALRESEGKYRMLMEEASDGIHTYDMQGNFIEANSKLCEMLGYTREELLRLNVKDLVTAADLAADPIRFDELRAGGTLLNERRLRRKDGTLLPVEISGKMIQDGVLQAIIRDVTARKRAEEALRRAHDELELKVAERTAELTDINEALQAEARARGRSEEARSRLLRQLVTAQEEERHRVARELHDGTGQYLTALMLELKSLESSSEGRSSTIKSVKKLQGLTDQLAVTVHHLAWELRPTALDDFGLQTALWNYAEQWSEACRIPVNFRSIGLDGERLPTQIETTIYRVVQEALNNVLKHAQAHGVSLILIRDPNDVVAVVEDDGRGFDVAAVTNKPAGEGGLGLLGMKERVVLAGGTISIESAPGQGTAILVRIPLTPAGTEKTDRE